MIHLAPQGSGWMDGLLLDRMLAVSGICRIINHVYGLGNDKSVFMMECIAIKYCSRTESPISRLRFVSLFCQNGPKVRSEHLRDRNAVSTPFYRPLGLLRTLLGLWNAPNTISHGFMSENAPNGSNLARSAPQPTFTEWTLPFFRFQI